MNALIYHNPRCSKSRETLQLLIERGVQVEIVDYQATPPSPATLRALLAKLGQPARAVVRFKDELAAELGLSPDDVRSEDEWLALLSTHPQLLERPMVAVGDRAVIGRPPENVLSLF